MKIKNPAIRINPRIIYKIGPFTIFLAPIPTNKNIANIIINVNNVCPISPCKSTKPKQRIIKIIGPLIILKLPLNCGNFYLIHKKYKELKQF